MSLRAAVRSRELSKAPPDRFADRAGRSARRPAVGWDNGRAPARSRPAAPARPTIRPAVDRRDWRDRGPRAHRRLHHRLRPCIPGQEMVPLAPSSSPAMRLSRVDFPLPEGPSSATSTPKSPRFSERLKPLLDSVIDIAGRALEAEDRYVLGCSTAAGKKGGLLRIPN